MSDLPRARARSRPAPTLRPQLPGARLGRGFAQAYTPLLCYAIGFPQVPDFQLDARGALFSVRENCEMCACVPRIGTRNFLQICNLNPTLLVYRVRNGEAVTDGPREGAVVMAQASCRILLVDPSVPRAQALCGTLAKAGWEIWPGRNIQDALLLAAGLPFDVVLAHEGTTRLHPELWKQLAESAPGACWLVHTEDLRRHKPQSSRGVLGSDPALILAVLMLVLEERPATRAQAA